MTGEARQQNTHIHEGDGRTGIARLLSSRALPWLVCGAVGIAGVLFEAFLDSTVFAQSTFLHALLYSGAHEQWMHGVTGVSLLVIAFMWSRVIRERDARTTAAEAYSERLGELVADVSRDDVSGRQRVADSLHEDVGQHLVAARLFLESVIENEASGENVDSMRSVSRLLDRAVESCRDLAEDISPRSLDEYGLESALANLSATISRRDGMHVSFDGIGADVAPLSREASLVAFGVFAALLGGAVLDHSMGEIELSTALAPDDYVASITWTGSLDWDLFAAEERLRSVGGHLELLQHDGRVSVSVALPIVS